MPAKTTKRAARKPVRKSTPRKATKRVAKKAAPRKAPAARRPRSVETNKSSGQKMGRTKMVRAYLDTLKEKSGGAAVVTLSGIPGINTGKYNDPDIIDRAVVALTSMADEEPNSIREVKLRQRAIALRRDADRIRAFANGKSPRAQFVVVGRQWAKENNISYEALRDMGVPALVLKDAGIVRSGPGRDEAA